MAIVGDVIDAKAVRAMVEQTVTTFGGVQILINNAGVLRPTKVVDIPEDEWDWVIAVNLKGTFLLLAGSLARDEIGWVGTDRQFLLDGWEKRQHRWRRSLYCRESGHPRVHAASR